MARNESDSAWKDVLDAYLKDFFDYCLPRLSDQIDWRHEWKQFELEYIRDVHQLEGVRDMPYISTAERIGIARGMEQGMAKGIEKGVEKGIEKGIVIVASRLLAEGMEPIFIARITNLPLAQVEGLGNDQAIDINSTETIES